MEGSATNKISKRFKEINSDDCENKILLQIWNSPMMDENKLLSL